MQVISGFGFQGLGFRVLRFRVLGFQGLGFRVSGSILIRVSIRSTITIAVSIGVKYH